MATVSWGAPTLQFIPLAAGAEAPSGSWEGVTGFIEIAGDDLLEGSSQLETSEGDKKTLNNERGVAVDRKQMPSAYSFKTSVIKKKGYQSKFASVNGVVAGDWAMRLIAEDPEAVGFTFGKCVISTADGWTADQGALENLTVDGVEPNGTDKQICKDYSVQQSGD